MNTVPIDVAVHIQKSITLVISDKIVDSNRNKFKVSYIDYIEENVVAENASVVKTIPFDVIATGKYNKVVE